MRAWRTNEAKRAPGGGFSIGSRDAKEAHFRPSASANVRADARKQSEQRGRCRRSPGAFADAAAKGVAMTYEDVLLLIAADEGQGIATYAKRAGVSKTVMSHWINELSDRARHHKTPGLVAWQPHPLKEREAQVFLTPLGVLAAEQLQGRRRP